MLYLAFITEIGRLVDGKYLYNFSFTTQPDIVWGEFFHIAPTILVPNLVPDEENICEEYKVSSKYKLVLATKSGCFSMQDAFENIIPLAFVDIEKHDLIYYKDKVLKFEFGETIDITEDKFKECDFEIIEKTTLKESENEEEVIEENEDFELENEEETKPLIISVGDIIKPEEIKKKLFSYGYRKVDFVYNEGEYAIRGSIIDIYPYNSNEPYTINFDNNTIDKIYSFDLEESNPIKYYQEITVDLQKITYDEW